jgi:D-tyrosyl-tRNA(Tyr) deacylase
MRILIQRVKTSKVVVEERDISQIGDGLLLFVGVGRDDNENDVQYLAKKVINLRIFEDEQGKMNLNVYQVKGQILSVSQFTLYANTKKGNRPGFDQSADPEMAEKYWIKFNDLLRGNGIEVQEGMFGAHMEIELLNDGPVTIWLDSKDRS